MPPTPTPPPKRTLQDGDSIVIDAGTRRMDITNVTDAELAARRAAWKAPPLKATSGTLYKYIKNVSSASEGCITDGP
jgi:dihydroxy-acid dehydratase